MKIDEGGGGRARDVPVDVAQDERPAALRGHLDLVVSRGARGFTRGPRGGRRLGSGPQGGLVQYFN